MKSIQEISFHPSADTGASYQWTDCESLNASISGKIGGLECNSKVKNANLSLTPFITVSPVIGEKYNEFCYVFVTCVEKKVIEIWKVEAKALGLKYYGYFDVPKLDNRSEIAVDFASRHLKDICGDVTYFSLFISCPESSVITYVAIPTQEEFDSNHIFFGNICHSGLFKPTAMESWINGDGSILLAVLSVACGDIFIFQKNNWSYVFLKVIKLANFGSEFSSSSIALDHTNRLYIAQEKDIHVFKLDSNYECTYEMNYSNDKLRVDRIHCCMTEKGKVVLGSSPRNNRVVLLESNSDKLSVRDLLEPCSVVHPRCITSVPYFNILMLAERWSTAKGPLVSFYLLDKVPVSMQT